MIIREKNKIYNYYTISQTNKQTNRKSLVKHDTDIYVLFSLTTEAIPSLILDLVIECSERKKNTTPTQFCKQKKLTI